MYCLLHLLFIWLHLFSYIGYIKSVGRITGNDQFRRMWKEAAVACFKELSQCLPGNSESNHKRTSVKTDSPLLAMKSRTSFIQSQNDNHLTMIFCTAPLPCVKAHVCVFLCLCVFVTSNCQELAIPWMMLKQKKHDKMGEGSFLRIRSNPQVKLNGMTRDIENSTQYNVQWLC